MKSNLPIPVKKSAFYLTLLSLLLKIQMKFSFLTRIQRQLQIIHLILKPGKRSYNRFKKIISNRELKTISITRKSMSHIKFTSIRERKSEYQNAIYSFKRSELEICIKQKESTRNFRMRDVNYSDVSSVNTPWATRLEIT